MTPILQIFRKDARHLIWHAVAFWAMMALAAIEFVANGSQSQYQSLLDILTRLFQAVACWVLIVAAIHEERLIGHRQYWLARPYSWKRLLAAKALFVLAFVSVPLFICQSATLTAVGISPVAWLPALFWRQVFFTIFVILPAVAIAAVTRNLGQVLLTVIVGYLVLGLSLGVVLRGFVTEWGGFRWILTCAEALVVSAGVAAAVWTQYSRRRTFLSRAIVVLTAVLAMVLASARPWPRAFAIQSLFSRERVIDAEVRVFFDGSRQLLPLQPTPSGRGNSGAVTLGIPFRVEGVPPGVVLEPDWTSVTIQGPDATERDVTLHGLVWSENDVLPVSVSLDFFERAKQAPVRLHGTIELTLYRRADATPELSPGSTVFVPELGRCTAQYWPQAICQTPAQHVEIGRIDGRPESAGFEVLGGPLPPFPVSIGFLPLDTIGIPLTRSPTWRGLTARLPIYRPVAHIRRTLETPAIRMSDYLPR